MSKKSLFYQSHGRGNSLSGVEAQGEQPQLFARRTSSARPFVISANDSPYHNSNSEYISSSRHARSKSTVTSGPNSIFNRVSSALGVTKVQRHTTRRSRRILAFGLIALVVFLVNYQRSGSRYLGDNISRPFATARKLFNPAAFAVGGLSARSERGTQAASLPSTGHTFHPNGLMLVNPNGAHPIHSLIDNAEKRWNNLLAKQSTTLDEAAQEYKRRYKRNPPAGFDAW